MQRVIVQVPMPKDLKKKAETVSSDMGFSSLQETIRVMLTKLAKKELVLKFEETENIPYLSPTAEKRFKKTLKDIKSGKNIYKPKDEKEFFRLLES